MRDKTRVTVADTETKSTEHSSTDSAFDDASSARCLYFFAEGLESDIIIIVHRGETQVLYTKRGL